MRRVLALIGLLLLTAPRALACTCQAELSVAYSRGLADAVFVGEVLSIRDRSFGAGGRSGKYIGRVARLRVLTAWKGVAPGTILKMFTGHGGDCGYDFGRSSRHLVYATRWGNKTELTTNICTRSRPMPYGAPDSVALSRLVTLR